MRYIMAGMLGLGIGTGNVFLLLLMQKKEALQVFEKKGIYQNFFFWLETVGMLIVGIYYMWLIEKWGYILGVQLLLAGYLLPLSIVDYRYKQLPDLFHAVYGVVFLLYKVFTGSWYDLLGGAAAAACVLLFFGAVHLVKKDQLGLGDLKMLCVCAFLAGVPSIIYIFFRGLIVAAVYSAVQLIRHKAALKTEYPLAPFLLVGVLV